MSQSRSDIFTVSKLNRFAKHILESEIGSIWLSAEISNFVAASSGHWYFTLKDPRAQVKAAMFKGANRRVRQQPREGDKVLVRGDISVYEARGDYQLIVSHLEADGRGDLKAQFEQLKGQLATEGLFAQEHKQPLPQRAQTIGIVTSATGAAVKDVLTVFKRRNPGIEIVIYPSLVQGTEAPAGLINAIRLANQRAEVDALILTRGGGSMEDLWCFNDEGLARTIFASELPVISAVGHEIDFTISDFVADARAATPSAAAEILSYSNEETQQHLNHLNQRLVNRWQQRLQAYQHQLRLNEQSLKSLHPQRQIQQQWQQLDALNMRLREAGLTGVDNARHRLEQLKLRLKHQSPQTQIADAQSQLQRVSGRLKQEMSTKLQQCKQQMLNTSHLLDTVSPLATLSRGYSITYQGSEVLKDAEQTKPGIQLRTRLGQGEVISRVESINKV